MKAGRVVCDEIVSYVRAGGILLSMQGELNKQLGFEFQAVSSVTEQSRLASVRVLSSSIVAGSKFAPSETSTPSSSSSEQCDYITFRAPSVWASPAATSDDIGRVDSSGLGELGTLDSEVESREILAVFHHEPPEETVESPSHSTAAETGGSNDSGSRAEEEQASPCFQKAIFRSGGLALLSYVDVLPPIHEESDISKLVQLKRDTEARIDFLRAVLSGAGLECSSSKVPDVTHTYLVCSEKVVCFRSVYRLR